MFLSMFISTWIRLNGVFNNKPLKLFITMALILKVSQHVSISLHGQSTLNSRTNNWFNNLMEEQKQLYQMHMCVASVE